MIDQTERSANVGVAVVGQGFIARAHCTALQHLRRVDGTCLRLVSLCGRDQDRARANAQQWGFERVDEDWRSVVDAADVDLVCVFATDDLHRQVAVAALEAGKSVLCEKPLGLSLEESTEMVEAAERNAGQLAACSFNYRYVPAVQLARRLITAGEIGRIAHFRAVYLQDWGWDAPFGWHFQRVTAGAGAVGDYNHIIDLAHHLVGDVERVGAETLTISETRTDASGAEHRVDVADAYVASARFAGGGLLSLEASRAATGRKAQQAFEINGELGALRWDMEDFNVLWFHRRGDGALGGFRRILVTEPEHPDLGRWWPSGHVLGWEHSLVHQWAGLSALLDDVEVSVPQATFTDGRRADVVVDAVVRAAAEGRSIHVDYALPTGIEA